MRPPKSPGREPAAALEQISDSRLQIAVCRFQKGTRNLKMPTKCHQIADCRIPGEPWVLVVHSEGRMQIADSRRQIAATMGLSVRNFPSTLRSSSGWLATCRTRPTRSPPSPSPAASPATTNTAGPMRCPRSCASTRTSPPTSPREMRPSRHTVRSLER